MIQKSSTKNKLISEIIEEFHFLKESDMVCIYYITFVDIRRVYQSNRNNPVEEYLANIENNI